MGQGVFLLFTRGYLWRDLPFHGGIHCKETYIKGEKAQNSQAEGSQRQPDTANTTYTQTVCISDGLVAKKKFNTVCLRKL